MRSLAKAQSAQRAKGDGRDALLRVRTDRQVDPTVAPQAPTSSILASLRERFRSGPVILPEYEGFACAKCVGGRNGHSAGLP